jgi:hypothetical protein
LQQSPEDDKWHPVAYYSKSLSAVERNYKIHDKEMLAVIRALEDWCHFLEGAHHEVEIWTDHGTRAGDNSNVTLLCPEFFATHAV